jgi:hypothetical protein
LQVKGQSVRIGIEAPRSVRVLRSELPKHETSDDHQPVASKATGSQPAKAKPRQVLGDALSDRSSSRSSSRQSPPLANRLDLRRSPQRMESAVVRFDSAVRSISFPR